MAGLCVCTGLAPLPFFVVCLSGSRMVKGSHITAFFTRWWRLPPLSLLVRTYQHSGLALWSRCATSWLPPGLLLHAGLSLTVFQYPPIYNALGFACGLVCGDDIPLLSFCFVEGGGFEPPKPRRACAHLRCFHPGRSVSVVLSQPSSFIVPCGFPARSVLLRLLMCLALSRELLFCFVFCVSIVSEQPFTLPRAESRGLT